MLPKQEFAEQPAHGASAGLAGGVGAPTPVLQVPYQPLGLRGGSGTVDSFKDHKEGARGVHERLLYH